ncbi:hypothetical protein GQ42DRAFT_168824, partial [Ramicandelaber brevisporus]
WHVHTYTSPSHPLNRSSQSLAPLAPLAPVPVPPSSPPPHPPHPHILCAFLFVHTSLPSSFCLICHTGAVVCLSACLSLFVPCSVMGSPSHPAFSCSNDDIATVVDGVIDINKTSSVSVAGAGVDAGVASEPAVLEFDFSYSGVDSAVALNAPHNPINSITVSSAAMNLKSNINGATTAMSSLSQPLHLASSGSDDSYHHVGSDSINSNSTSNVSATTTTATAATATAAHHSLLPPLLIPVSTASNITQSLPATTSVDMVDLTLNDSVSSALSLGMDLDMAQVVADAIDKLSDSFNMRMCDNPNSQSSSSNSRRSNSINVKNHELSLSASAPLLPSGLNLFDLSSADFSTVAADFDFESISCCSASEYMDVASVAAMVAAQEDIVVVDDIDMNISEAMAEAVDVLQQVQDQQQQQQQKQQQHQQTSSTSIAVPAIEIPSTKSKTTATVVSSSSSSSTLAKAVKVKSEPAAPFRLPAAYHRAHLRETLANLPCPQSRNVGKQEATPAAPVAPATTSLSMQQQSDEQEPAVKPGIVTGITNTSVPKEVLRKIPEELTDRVLDSLRSVCSRLIRGLPLSNSVICKQLDLDIAFPSDKSVQFSDALRDRVSGTVLNQMSQYIAQRLERAQNNIRGSGNAGTAGDDVDSTGEGAAGADGVHAICHKEEDPGIAYEWLTDSDVAKIADNINVSMNSISIRALILVLHALIAIMLQAQAQALEQAQTELQARTAASTAAPTVASSPKKEFAEQSPQSSVRTRAQARALAAQQAKEDEATPKPAKRAYNKSSSSATRKSAPPSLLPSDVDDDMDEQTILSRLPFAENALCAPVCRLPSGRIKHVTASTIKWRSYIVPANTILVQYLAMADDSEERQIFGRRLFTVCVMLHHVCRPHLRNSSGLGPLSGSESAPTKKQLQRSKSLNVKKEEPEPSAAPHDLMMTGFNGISLRDIDMSASHRDDEDNEDNGDNDAGLEALTCRKRRAHPTHFDDEAGFSLSADLDFLSEEYSTTSSGPGSPAKRHHRNHSRDGSIDNFYGMLSRSSSTRGRGRPPSGAVSELSLDEGYYFNAARQHVCLACKTVLPTPQRVRAHFKLSGHLKNVVHFTSAANMQAGQVEELASSILREHGLQLAPSYVADESFTPKPRQTAQRKAQQSRRTRSAIARGMTPPSAASSPCDDDKMSRDYTSTSTEVASMAMPLDEDDGFGFDFSIKPSSSPSSASTHGYPALSLGGYSSTNNTSGTGGRFDHISTSTSHGKYFAAARNSASQLLPPDQPQLTLPSDGPAPPFEAQLPSVVVTADAIFMPASPVSDSTFEWE